MKTLFRSLFSNYIIDGVKLDSTPVDMLMECCAPEDLERLFPAPEQPFDGTIVDESGDLDPSPLKYEFSKLEIYSQLVRNSLALRNSVNLDHPHSSARVILAESVIKYMLCSRPPRLEGLALSVSFRWDCGPVGNMAAFYKAVEAVSGYAYDLGIRFTELDFEEVEGAHEIVFDLAGSTDGAVKGFEGFAESCEDDGTDGGILPNEVTSCEGNLIFVPFDTCSHKLGGSLFSGTLEGGDEVGPEIYDPDYFIDSYEVVHDLVEDGVALCGTAVGRGGLITAVERILGERFRLNMDIGGIQKTYMEDDPVRILFAEVPGVVLQIKDEDRDYVDAQFLLQDIAYYPLGKPEMGTDIDDGRKIRMSVESRIDLSRILSSLLEGHKSEDPEINNFAEGAETERGGAED